MKIECETCGRSPADGHTVFRVNAKGQPGCWRCKYHRSNVVVDLSVERVVRTIEKADAALFPRSGG